MRLGRAVAASVTGVRLCEDAYNEPKARALRSRCLEARRRRFCTFDQNVVKGGGATSLVPVAGALA